MEKRRIHVGSVIKVDEDEYRVVSLHVGKEKIADVKTGLSVRVLPSEIKDCEVVGYWDGPSKQVIYYDR